MPEIRVKRGTKEIESYFFSENIITIGRSPINQICLLDSTVSRFHSAIIENERGDYFIRDLGSLNGIKVNGKECLRKILQEGDKIRIGNYVLEFHKSEEEIELSDIIIKPTPAKSKDKFSESQSISTDFFKESTIFIDESHKIPKEILSKVSREMEETLYDIFRKLKLIKNFEMLVKEMMDSIQHILNPKCGYVAKLNEDGTLRPIRLLEIDLKRGGKIPVITAEIFEEVVKKSQCSWSPKYVCIPLKSKNKVIGLIYLESPPENRFSEKEINFLNLLVSGANSLIPFCAEKFSEDSQILSPELFKWKEKLVGNRKAKAMKEVYKKIEEAIRTDMNVLILGETGSGKEQVAKKIHKESQRKREPFETIDCSALPETLVESELFGYAPHSGISGADPKGKPGMFEVANKGTIFIDEIGDMNFYSQAKIRRVIETKEVRRLSSTKTITIDVRVISATNKNLEEEIKKGKFRKDLYNRLSEIVIKLPPLRERREDIPLLAHFFVDELCKETEGISHEAIRLLTGSYEWPGNIRELRSVVKNACLTGKKVLSPWDFPEKIQRVLGEESKKDIKKKSKRIEEREKEWITEVLKEVYGNKSKAAKLLGITRQTLDNKIKKYKIPVMKWGQ